MGFVAGINATLDALGEPSVFPDPNTAHGALLGYLANADARDFQPMNVNFGLFPPLPAEQRRLRKREKNEQYAARALESLAPYARATAELLR